MVNVNDAAFVDYCVDLTGQINDMTEEMVRIGDRYEAMCMTLDRLYDMLDTINDAVHGISEIDEISEDQIQVRDSGDTTAPPEVQADFSGHDPDCDTSTSNSPTGYNPTHCQYQLPL